MRSGTNHFLVCGTPGVALDDDERRLLGELRPGGVVLFARNIEERSQLAALVAELRALPSRPYVAVDLEGGRVNRLRALVGPLPTAARAAGAGEGAIAALGEAIGAACAHFGIGVDYAPVLDVARADGWLGGEDRCFGHDVDGVVGGAGAFLAGLERYGVAGCLKHYPGLGSGAVDSHHELPLLDDTVVDEERAFAALVRPGRAVMVAHAVAPALGEAALPASLSAEVVGRLHAFRSGPVIADDLGMGALAAFGSIPERAAAALRAGCDQVPVCNEMPARPAVVEWLLRWADRDAVLGARLRSAAARCGDFGCGELRPTSWPEVERLCARARTLGGLPAEPRG